MNKKLVGVSVPLDIDVFALNPNKEEIATARDMRSKEILKVWQHIEGIWKVLKSMDDRLKTEQDVAAIQQAMDYFKEKDIPSATPTLNQDKE